MKSISREIFAALWLTIGMGVLLAALAAGHADDAPGVGLIGCAGFFICAVFAFTCIRERDGG